ncbi:response regulator [Streptomyces sp. Tu6071]|uniref:response regulator n=1 Tax=Streptomyces sp. Tu6071 TaxID=355249 RepID=UPI0005BD21C6|nr:response regulator transcription factor [Streptomyces sp. Tu6071]
MTLLTVVVADDERLVRESFAAILDAEEGIQVLTTAGDGAACVEAARRLSPDVVLADVRMPLLDGVEVARALANTPIGVVLITAFDEDTVLRAALRLGASGFLLKDASPALLVEAVRAAARGDALVSPSLTLRLLRGLAPQDPEPTVLSAREQEITEHVAQGRTNQEIGTALGLSLSSVKTYLDRVRTKLGLRNRVEIAAWAWERGLVQAGGRGR